MQETGAQKGGMTCSRAWESSEQRRRGDMVPSQGQGTLLSSRGTFHFKSGAAKCHHPAAPWPRTRSFGKFHIGHRSPLGERDVHFCLFKERNEQPSGMSRKQTLVQGLSGSKRNHPTSFDAFILGTMFHLLHRDFTLLGHDSKASFAPREPLFLRYYYDKVLLQN